MVDQRRKAVAYVRISADREGRELGVARQEQDARELAGRLGWIIVRVFGDNDLSASSRSRKPRPGYQAMLAAVRGGEASAIVAYSTSRLTRRPREFEDLIDLAEQGVKIATTRTGDLDLNTARGRRRARDDAARDAEYADEVSELAKRERQQRREQGRWHGGNRPFGFERDGTTARPDEQALIRQACRDVLAGRSLAAIARDWTAAGLLPAQSGRPWRPTAVREVLVNGRVAGMLPCGRPAVWEPIVDEPTWRGVVGELSRPERRRERGPIRLLTGVAVCGHCGATVNGGVGWRSGNPTYRCSAERHLERVAPPVDAFVTAVLLSWLARERLEPVATDDDTARLATEAAAMRARLDAGADAYAAGRLPLAAWERADRQLRVALSEVEARMATARGVDALARLPLDLPALEAWWAGANVDDRRAVLRASRMQMTIHPPGRGARIFDSNSVSISWRAA